MGSLSKECVGANEVKKEFFRNDIYEKYEKNSNLFDADFLVYQCCNVGIRNRESNTTSEYSFGVNSIANIENRHHFHIRSYLQLV